MLHRVHISLQKLLTRKLLYYKKFWKSREARNNNNCAAVLAIMHRGELEDGFYNSIIFFDELSFTRDGSVSKYNYHY